MSEALRISIPGKVFLLGEYAVLAGLPAIVAAVPPRFELRPVSKGDAPAFHPESPAGKLLSAAGSPRFPYEFHDPLQGAGGFGASTAQFAMAYRVLAERHGWEHGWAAAWARYRELSLDAGGMPPSGADLATQWLGGIVKFQIGEGGIPTQRSVGTDLPWSSLMVFAASHQKNRKTATHHHLGALRQREFPDVVSRLRLSLEIGLKAIEHGDLAGFGQVMGLYADELREAGLEITATYEDRQALRRLPGVLGVKGTGAYQSDAVIVLAEGDAPCKARIVEAALARDLRLVTPTLEPEAGIRLEPEART